MRVILLIVLALSLQRSFAQASLKFPYAEAGLNDRQAAAHLLSRFTYGVRPKDIDAVVSKGIDQWFITQLNPSRDAALESRLESIASYKFTNEQIVNRYFRAGEVFKMAMKDGVIADSAINDGNKKQYRAVIERYAKEKEIFFESELIKDLGSQKLLRSVYGEHQLLEVLTEFWFNHFNVSFTKGNCVKFIPNYERDVIRPNALGSFESLLIGTAKSPAMLLYLDNFISVADQAAQSTNSKKKKRGLNENYARELMELHTLGVDGGYTQDDVVNVARILTGWTVYRKSGNVPKTLKSEVSVGEFFFAANRHDDNEKTVLGKHFEKGGGLEEGISLLKMLASHPSTAKFISRKLAIRFVNDDPSPALIARMSEQFLKKKGDIKSVLITMVSSVEFWHQDAVREKTKSPFELAVSAIRAMNSEVVEPGYVFKFITGMGQKMYHYQAPTGFPDQGKFWINTGALLNRMNFGMSIATGKVRGIKTDLLALNGGHEPESSQDALRTYCNILLPTRDVEETIMRLTPMLNDPELQTKIGKAAKQNKPARPDEKKSVDEVLMEDVDSTSPQNQAIAKSESYQLADIVGVIIGSPEFQRR